MNIESSVKDYYRIVESKPMIDFVKKFIDAAPDRVLVSYWCDTLNMNTFSKYLTRTTGQMYVKMLDVIDHKGEASYRDIYDCLLKPKGKSFGNGAESFRNCETKGLMELDHRDKYKRKFFRLTALGKLVLETAKKNDIAYRVLRHFMKLDEGCDFDQKMITIQLNPDTLNDVTPEAFTSMLEAILDSKSELYEVGSYAYWCNKLVEALKKNPSFLEIFNCPEVNAWLEANQTVPAVQRFSKVFSKIMKKSKKNAA